MEHFHTIVSGYRFHNIATEGSSKESLFNVVHIHLKCLPHLKKESLRNNE